MGTGEYDKRLGELRDQAVGQMAGNEPRVTPMAAMEAGGREAHALMAQAAIGDPKTQIARDTLKKLDEIDRKNSDLVAAVLLLVDVMKE